MTYRDVCCQTHRYIAMEFSWSQLLPRHLIENWPKTDCFDFDLQDYWPLRLFPRMISDYRTCSQPVNLLPGQSTWTEIRITQDHKHSTSIYFDTHSLRHRPVSTSTRFDIDPLRHRPVSISSPFRHRLVSTTSNRENPIELRLRIFNSQITLRLAVTELSHSIVSDHHPIVTRSPDCHLD